MTDHESQPVLTRQLAAECDMLRLRSAAHERTEAELRRELSEAIKDRDYHKQTAADAMRLAGDAIEASKAKQDGIDKLRAKVTELSVMCDSREDQCDFLKEQVKQYKESLRLIQQMRRAEW